MVFAYMQAFIQGFRYKDSLPSLLQCAENLQLSVRAFITYRMEWRTYNDTSPNSGYVFDVTRWISNTIAPSSRYCYQVFLEGRTWVHDKMVHFPGGFSDWLPAWVQSIFGQVMSVKAIASNM